MRYIHTYAMVVITDVPNVVLLEEITSIQHIMSLIK